MIHLCIGDQSMYRLETNPQERHAEVCLNDPDYVTDYLIPVFDKLFSSDTSEVIGQFESVYN